MTVKIRSIILRSLLLICFCGMSSIVGYTYGLHQNPDMLLFKDWLFFQNTVGGSLRFLIAVTLFLVFIDFGYLGGINTWKMLKEDNRAYAIFAVGCLWCCVYAMGPL